MRRAPCENGMARRRAGSLGWRMNVGERKGVRRRGKRTLEGCTLARLCLACMRMRKYQEEVGEREKVGTDQEEES